MGNSVPMGTPSWAMPRADAGAALVFDAIKGAFGVDTPLMSLERILRKVQKSIIRLKTPRAKLRAIAQAFGELELHYRETSTRISHMERIGDIDDPVSCYGYLERIELMIKRLELLSDKVEQDSIEEAACGPALTEVRSIPLISQPETPERLEAPEFMNVEELAAFLHVSPSTIYHRSRNGDIPTRRVGARLLFSREEIKAWLVSTKQGTKSVA